MYSRSTFWWLDFGDARLCQRGNQRYINLPVEWDLKRVFIHGVWLEFLEVLV